MRPHAWKFGILLVLALALLAAVPVLGEDDLTGLADHDPEVREAATARLSTEVPMDDLLYELGEEHAPLVKGGLAEAIRRQGVTSGEVSDLTALLEHDDATTRHQAALLLEPVAASAWRSLEAVATKKDEGVLVRAAAVRVLGSAGAQARGVLRDLALDESLVPTLRYAALTSLACVSEAGVADVRRVAADGERSFADRRAAIQALTSPRCATGESVLILLTRHLEAAVRREAAHALVRRGGLTCGPTLGGLLGDGDAKVRHAALQGLDALGLAGRHTAGVVGRLFDLDPRVQALAARVAGQTCGGLKATVLPTLRGLLLSASFRVRYEAALSLNALGDKSGAPTMLADQNTTNVSQTLQAGQAYSLITGV